MKNALLLLALAACLSACVPKDQYDSLVIERDYYRNRSLQADSLADLRAVQTYEQEDNTSAELVNAIRQMESLKATNQALNDSYSLLSDRYDQLLQQNQKLLANTGEEVTGLQQTLAERTKEVSRREAELREMELGLQAREEAIARLEADRLPAGADPATYGGTVLPGGANGQPSPQATALRLNTLQNALTQQLNFLRPGTYGVEPSGSGAVRVTLAESLLTTDGFTLTQQGSEILRGIATTLRNYPKAEISIIGHADGSETDEQLAYEESVDKAINVAGLLREFGVNPARLVASGRGFYAPVADSSTDAGRSANRRMELVVNL